MRLAHTCMCANSMAYTLEHSREPLPESQAPSQVGCELFQTRQRICFSWRFSGAKVANTGDSFLSIASICAWHIHICVPIQRHIRWNTQGSLCRKVKLPLKSGTSSSKPARRITSLGTSTLRTLLTPVTAFCPLQAYAPGTCMYVCHFKRIYVGTSEGASARKSSSLSSGVRPLPNPPED